MQSVLGVFPKNSSFLFPPTLSKHCKFYKIDPLLIQKPDDRNIDAKKSDYEGVTDDTEVIRCSSEMGKSCSEASQSQQREH